MRRFGALDSSKANPNSWSQLSSLKRCWGGRLSWQFLFELPKASTERCGRPRKEVLEVVRRWNPKGVLEICLDYAGFIVGCFIGIRLGLGLLGSSRCVQQTYGESSLERTTKLRLKVILGAPREEKGSFLSSCHWQHCMRSIFLRCPV